MINLHYYEFCTSNKPLTAPQVVELGNRHSKAKVTPEYLVLRQFSPANNFMDFFDAGIYITKFGDCHFSLKLPKNPFRAYHVPFAFDVVGEQLTWTLNNSEMYPPRFNSRWLERLLPLRSEIMEGDLRPLYLGWLCGVRDGFVKNTAPKPPRPKGLNNLTPAQTTLVDFLALKIDASFLI
ncbi:MAG: hypothetical protein QX192_00475 [Methylococcales bacterium]